VYNFVSERGGSPNEPSKLNIAQKVDNNLTKPNFLYAMTGDGKGRYIVSENGRQIGRIFSREDALRICRALADADTLETRIRLLSDIDPIRAAVAVLQSQPVDFVRAFFARNGGM
jgi:hypothetical protein